MFKNYLKIALRNQRKHRGYTFINIVGLAVGMTCCMMILLYTHYELSYDRVHKNRGRIYRVVRDSEQSGVVRHVATTPSPLAPAVQRGLPEVKYAIRMLPQEHLVRFEKKAFVEERFFYVDSTFFKVFTSPLQRGNPQTALVEPYSVVITQEAAYKYFGNENPVGKTLVVEDGQNFLITGTLEPIPKNMHFHFDFLASFRTLGIDETQNWRWRNQNNFYTYLLLTGEQSHELLEEKIDEIYEANTGQVMSQAGWKIRTVLQPLASIHLHSNLEWEIEPNGNAATVYILSTIAFFILLLACINFVNLTTARSFERAKEVGLRKVLGAYRGNLIKQFLGESSIIALLALLVAMGLIDLFLPAFNSIAGLQLTIDYTRDWVLLIGYVTLALVVGLVGGIYPAFFLSNFGPIQTFKSLRKIGILGVTQRKGLVVFQFVIAIVLIVGTGVMNQQLQFVKNKRLGFTKEQVVALPLQGASLTQNYESVKNELLKHPDVLSVTAAYSVPGAGTSQNTFRVEGVPEEARPSMKTLYVDYDYIKTLGIEVKAGRDFSRDFATDAAEGFILNEAAVKILGWDNPIGKQFGWWNRDGRVIGVVEDFHFASLHQKIEPLVLLIFPDMFRQLAVRILPQDVSATLSFLENTWQSFVPERPFQYSFLDESFARLYKSDQRFQQVWNVFAGLAIFVACLGLFGLTALSTTQRTKEIAVRKVLGASAGTVVGLISKDFIRLVLVSIIVAWPVSWYAMNKWLQNFAFRIEIGWWVFVLTGGLALVIALLTVSTQAVRAALANPVESLRYD